MLQELLKSFNNETISQLSDSALKLLESITPPDGERGEAVQLQGSGISLWNKTVALKSAGAILPQLNAQSKNIYNHIFTTTTTIQQSPPPPSHPPPKYSVNHNYELFLLAQLF